MAKGNYESRIALNVENFSQKQPETAKKETPVKTPEVKKVSAPVNAPVKEKKESVDIDFLANIKKKRAKTNRSFYLEEEVYQNLSIFCKSKDISPSEYVNALIKNDLSHRM